MHLWRAGTHQGFLGPAHVLDRNVARHHDALLRLKRRTGGSIPNKPRRRLATAVRAPHPPRRRLAAVVETCGLSSASLASASGGQSGRCAALQFPLIMRPPPARPRPAITPCDHHILPPETHRPKLHFGGRRVAACDVPAPCPWRDVAQPGSVATSTPPVQILGALGRRTGLVFHSSSSSLSAVVTNHSSGVG